MSYFLPLMLLSVVCAVDFEGIPHTVGKRLFSSDIRLLLGRSAVTKQLTLYVEIVA